MNMKVDEFLNIIEKAYQSKNIYMLGTFGQKITESLIQSNARRLPSFYTASRIATCRQHIGEYAFDCIGLIKGVLWDWGTSDFAYASNNVPDYNELMLKNISKPRTDWANIQPGCAVWMSGHIGIYAGNGMCYESTPKWDNKIQKSYVANVKNVSATKKRTWTNWFYIPWVDYSCQSAEPTPIKPAPEKTDKLEIDGMIGPLCVTAMQRIFSSDIADGIVSNQSDANAAYAPASTCPRAAWQFIPYNQAIKTQGSSVIRALQKIIGAEADGFAGKEFWTKLSAWLHKKGYCDAVYTKCTNTLACSFQRYLNTCIKAGYKIV